MAFEFKVGDEVAVIEGWTNAPSRLARVARVLKTCIVLDDDSRWRLDGRKLGKPRGCAPRAYLEIATPARREALEHPNLWREAMHGIDKMNTAGFEVPIDKLRMLHAAVAAIVDDAARAEDGR